MGAAFWCLDNRFRVDPGQPVFQRHNGLRPCVLCWYQRVCMFPLVIILARGLFPLDRGVVKYALPLAGVGWLLAAYHNLLHSGWIPADMQPCAKGVSCTEEYLELFGLLSIPALALISFTTQMSILIVLKRRDPE